MTPLRDAEIFRIAVQEELSLPRNERQDWLKIQLGCESQSSPCRAPSGTTALTVLRGEYMRHLRRGGGCRAQ